MLAAHATLRLSVAGDAGAGHEESSARVLALSMTLPAFAVASHPSRPATPRPRIPVCSALSRSAIANVVHFAPLVLEKRIGPTCAFSAESPGQYLQALSLQIIPGSNGVFSLAESDALESAEKEPGTEFGVAAKGLKVGKRA